MADKAISELIAADQITAADMFVLEQGGTAKRLTGQILLNWLTAAADGHGGISGIEKVTTNGLADTYRITLADTTTFDFVVSNGRSINNIEKTSTIDLVDTYTIAYNDGTSSTFTVTNGEKGATGAASYTWIKWASQEPTASSHSFGDIPDDWIGVYSGTASEAPDDWTQYQWFEIKGKQGEAGDPATLVSSAVEYQSSNSGTVIPSGTWSSDVPTVAQGKYLWTKTTQTFNTGEPVISYSVSRMGIDGLGAVTTVNRVSPDSDGNVQLSASDVDAVATDGSSTMTGSLKMGGNLVKNIADPVDDADAVSKSYAVSMFAKLIYRGIFSGDIDVVDNSDNLYINSVVWVDPNQTANLPYGNFGVCETWAANTALILQRITFTNQARCIRMYYNSKWYDWYWDNPPMLLGVEYLTTKRWNGNTVYVKLINIGTLPVQGTSKRVAHGCTFSEVVNMTVTVNGSSIAAFVANYSDGAIKAFLEESSGSVVLDNQLSADTLDSHTAKVLLEYVK